MHTRRAHEGAVELVQAGLDNGDTEASLLNNPRRDNETCRSASCRG